MKKQKKITYEPDLCSGCMYCMTSCSTYNNGITSLSNARIRIVRHEGFAITGMDEEDDLVFMPLICKQCDEAPCANACPVDAINYNMDTGAWVMDYDKCVLCMLCMSACPYGAMAFDREKGQPIKCELCNGDPWCVRMCTSQALKYD